jgi:phosphate starvation-inducible PhoH-like protein
MNDLVGIEAARDKISKGVIEIAPVAYMRGRTFNNCFVILDEAQNCTYTQIKMVLTRLGDNVKLVVSGDTSQSDLNGKSGLAKIVERLSKTDDVGITRFKGVDVVRSQIVKDVLMDLEKYEDKD